MLYGDLLYANTDSFLKNQPVSKLEVVSHLVTEYISQIGRKRNYCHASFGTCHLDTVRHSNAKVEQLLYKNMCQTH
jgi:hypothetical protein